MRALVLCLWLCSFAVPACGQFGGQAVYDAANHFENALQNARALIMIGNQLQDLAALSDMGQFADLVQQALDVATEVQGVAGPLVQRSQQWQALIEAGFRICTPGQMNTWDRTYDQFTAYAFSASGRAKQILTTAQDTIRSLMSALQAVLGINGSVAGLQNLNGLVGRLLTRTIAMEAQNASFQETVQRRELKEYMAEQGMNNLIDAQRLALRGRQLCP